MHLPIRAFWTKFLLQPSYFSGLLLSVRGEAGDFLYVCLMVTARVIRVQILTDGNPLAAAIAYKEPQIDGAPVSIFEFVPFLFQCSQAGFGFPLVDVVAACGFAMRLVRFAELLPQGVDLRE